MTTKKDKILVVDDENLNLELMEAKLTPLGYKVLLAKSGEETLEIVRKNPPDLILLELKPHAEVLSPHNDVVIDTLTTTTT